MLHSRAHQAWARRTGTQVREFESGFRYTPMTVFETFPLSQPASDQRDEIAAAAKRLDELRQGWLESAGAEEEELEARTLTKLCNETTR